MSSYQLLKDFSVPDGTASIFGFSESFLKKKILSNAKGIILFVHGFNSSAKIWGDENNGFVSLSIKNQFIPFVVDFSNARIGSIANMANFDLHFCFIYIQDFLSKNKAKKTPLPFHFVAHSMGGVITRYFLSTTVPHDNYDVSELKMTNIKSVALLGVPNHGISKSNSDNFVAKMEKIISDFNSFSGPKHSIKLVDQAYFQLLSGNTIITSLLNDLSTNMWPELFWMNFIAQFDIVVDHNSSFFNEDEVAFLGDNFLQKEFDATHMKNPLKKFTDMATKKIPFNNNKFLSSLEIKKPDFLGYLVNEPIYANKDLMKEYFVLVSKLN